ncbi:hypothetical protein BH11PSE8_BH11PSE8_43470 [soil metagenome]
MALSLFTVAEVRQVRRIAGIFLAGFFEQGRGFAVVATEVRSLAQRSASAAKEIKTLIGDSVERVEVGSAQALGAGQTIGELVASVKRVSGIVAEISAVSVQQAQGIDEINEAVSRLDQATQQNAALVEQSATATESPKDQAATLAESVQRFWLAAWSPGDLFAPARTGASCPGISAHRSAV